MAGCLAHAPYERPWPKWNSGLRVSKGASGSLASMAAMLDGRLNGSWPVAPTRPKTTSKSAAGPAPKLPSSAFVKGSTSVRIAGRSRKTSTMSGAEERWSRTNARAVLVADVDEFDSLERLGAAGDLERVSGSACREVGPQTESVGSEYVDRCVAAPVAVGESFGAHAVDLEAEGFEAGDEGGYGDDAGVDDDVEADSWPGGVVLDGVQEDHLAADEHPAAGYRLGDVDECRPEIRALTAEFGKDDHETDRGSYACIRSFPARDVR